MKKFTLLVFPLFIILLIACSSDSSDESSDRTSDECPVSEKNQIVYEIMKDMYLWYDQIPDVNPEAYNSPEELLEDLKYELDKWSFIMTQEEFNRYYEEGKYPGMGFSAAFDDEGRLWVEYVEANSPADIAGMKRTDEILQINGINISAFADLYALWDEIYRYDYAQITINASNGSVSTLPPLYWNWVTIKTVFYSNVITTDGGTKVGYMVFNGFIEPSINELDSVFSNFKSENIDELILDLRYNGGGSLDVAAYLASLISCPATDNDIFLNLIFNDKYPDYYPFYFTDSTNALGLSRVFVITTESTCSASEAVIDGLAPSIEVVVIGSATCGKPVGMMSYEICDIVLVPITFWTTNSDGISPYFDGISPDCPAEDDLTKAFGDETENSLATAIYYIDNYGSCSSLGTAERTMQSTDSRQKNQRYGLWREIRAF